MKMPLFAARADLMAAPGMARIRGRTRPDKSRVCAPLQFTRCGRHGIVTTEERTGANRSAQAAGHSARMRELTDVTGETLRWWREARGWDVPRMARELRRAARDSGEDVAAHHGLVKMIPQWERGGRVPRERYRLLYAKVFAATLGDLSQNMTLGTDVALRLADVGARAARLPAPGEVRALESAALGKPRKAMAPAEIRALAAEAITHLHAVADRLAELSALLDGDKPLHGGEPLDGDEPPGEDEP
jgi:transcriptional regulator with XRE-family HTH domain